MFKISASILSYLFPARDVALELPLEGLNPLSVCPALKALSLLLFPLACHQPVSKILCLVTRCPILHLAQVLSTAPTLHNPTGEATKFLHILLTAIDTLHEEVFIHTTCADYANLGKSAMSSTTPRNSSHSVGNTQPCRSSRDALGCVPPLPALHQQSREWPLNPPHLLPPYTP